MSLHLTPSDYTPCGYKTTMATLDSQVQNHKEAAILMVEDMGDEITPSQLKWLEQGIAQVDRLAEYYVAHIYGTEVNSVAGRDLANGLEVKFVCINDYSCWTWAKKSKNNPERVLRYSRGVYGAITKEGTRNKTGDIVVVLYDPFDKELRVINLRRGEDYTPGKAIRIGKKVDGSYNSRFVDRTLFTKVKGFQRDFTSVK